MNSHDKADKTSDKAEELKGKAKAAAGKATDDKSLEAEGKTDPPRARSSRSATMPKIR